MTTASTADRGRGPQDGDRGGPEPLAADVQRFGLLSAASVVSRYAAIVDRAVGTGASSGSGSARPRRDDAGPDWLAGLGPPVAEAALRIVDQAAALAEQATTTASPVAPEHLELPATRPGASSQVSVWLHNPTAASVVAQVRVTALVSGDGDVLPADAVVCQPSGHVQLASTGSCEVVLRVDVPTQQPSGRYHGLVVASAAPEPIRLALLVIRDRADAP